MPRLSLRAELARRIREDAGHRCGYCRSLQHLVMARLEIEHIVPLARGGSNDGANLWLACPICNAHKADKSDAIDPHSGMSVPLFNPRTQHWPEHFGWSADGLRIIGRTAIGRATVVALQLDCDPDALLVRAHWVAAGWHPPVD